jgi:hypothetical protein
MGDGFTATAGIGEGATGIGATTGGGIGGATVGVASASATAFGCNGGGGGSASSSSLERRSAARRNSPSVAAPPLQLQPLSVTSSVPKTSQQQARMRRFLLIEEFNQHRAKER